MTRSRARKRSVWRSRFVRDVISVSSGSAGAQVLNLALAPVLLRVYAPSEYGVLGVCTALLAFSIIGGARYDQAIPLPEDDRKGVALLWLSMMIATVVAAIGTASLVFYGEEAAAALGIEPFAAHLWVTGPVFWLAASNQFLRNYLIRKRSFRRIGAGTFAQSASQLGTQITLGLFDPSALSLVLGLVVGNLVCLAIQGPALFRDRHTGSSPTWTKQLRDVAREFREFPLLAMPAQLVNAAALQIVPILMARFYSTEVTGWLSVSNRVIGLPMITLGYGISQVFYQRAAAMWQETPDALHSFYRKSVLRLLALGIGPITIVAVLGPTLFEFVFGTEWRESGYYVRVLSLTFLAQFCLTPLSQVMAVIRAQQLQLGWDLARFALVSGALVGCGEFAVAPRTAIGAYSAAMVGSYVLLFVMTDRRIRISARTRQ